MKIILAIDIIDGKCVRLSKGKYSTKKIYNDNPLEIAKQFENFGIKNLHLVDLDGATSSHIINLKILEKIALSTNLEIDFGGGIKSDADIESAFNAGAKKITSGSIAVKKPKLFLKWIKKYGAEKIILGADCINKKIAIQGWRNKYNINVIDFIKKFKYQGLTHVICTDIEKDGMLNGPSTLLYQEILRKISIKLIASGGISSISDIKNIQKIGCKGVIIGKAIYENKISLKELYTLIKN